MLSIRPSLDPSLSYITVFLYFFDFESCVGGRWEGSACQQGPHARPGCRPQVGGALDTGCYPNILGFQTIKKQRTFFALSYSLLCATSL